MASILILTDGNSVAEEAAALLKKLGYRVLMCGGGPSPYVPCPLLKFGSCPLSEEVDLIIFSLGFFPSITGRSYGGTALLRAYRSHAALGGIPMVVTSEFSPRDSLRGQGRIEFLGERADRVTIVAAADSLLKEAKQPFGSREKGRMALPKRRRSAQALDRR